MREIEIACTLPEKELTQRIDSDIAALFNGAQAIMELDDGYAFTFDSDSEWFNRLCQFIAAERQCCAFLHFELIVPPNHAAIQLKILGSDEVKQFVQSIMPQQFSMDQKQAGSM